MNWHDIAERSIWTAVQAAAGIISATLLAGNAVTVPVLYTALAVAIAAGISVVKNVVVQKRTPPAE